MKNKIIMAMMGVMTIISMSAAASMVPVFADGNGSSGTTSGKVTCPAGTKRATAQVDSYAECNMDESVSGSSNNLWNTVSTIINAVLAVIGIVTVVMVIYGGFKITTAAGAADKVKSGKDTIVYGLVGMVIALMAYAIVNFVLGAVFGGTSTNSTACSSYTKDACPSTCKVSGNSCVDK